MSQSTRPTQLSLLLVMLLIGMSLNYTLSAWDSSELGKEDTPFSGQVTKSYPTGKPWYERGYKAGKKHGKTVEWFPNG